jgi:hypothetical protein
MDLKSTNLVIYGGQSKSPEQFCSTMDVTGFPNLVVQTNSTIIFCTPCQVWASPQLNHSLSPFDVISFCKFLYCSITCEQNFKTHNFSWKAINQLKIHGIPPFACPSHAEMAQATLLSKILALGLISKKCGIFAKISWPLIPNHAKSLQRCIMNADFHKNTKHPDHSTF